MNNNRLDSLNIERKESQSLNKNYTVFVKLMRYVLPVCAAGLIILAFIWPQLKSDLVVLEKSDLGISDKMQVGQTELISPNFETIDSNNNPVKVQAVKASQNQINPKLIKLEQPNADLLTKEGDKLNVQSDIGTYEQESEKLYLQENVVITHEEGYVLDAEELRLNMETQEAFSDKDVTITNDQSNIQATGVEGNMEEGVLTFKGPATLTWHPEKKDTNTLTEEQMKDGAIQDAAE